MGMMFAPVWMLLVTFHYVTRVFWVVNVVTKASSFSALLCSGCQFIVRNWISKLFPQKYKTLYMEIHNV